MERLVREHKHTTSKKKNAKNKNKRGPVTVRLGFQNEALE